MGRFSFAQYLGNLVSGRISQLKSISGEFPWERCHCDDVGNVKYTPIYLAEVIRGTGKAGKVHTYKIRRGVCTRVDVYLLTGWKYSQ